MADQDGLIVEIDLSSGGVNDSQTPAMKSLDDSGRVLHISNFATCLVPVCGWNVVVAPAEIIRELRKVRSLVAGPASRAASARCSSRSVITGYRSGEGAPRHQANGSQRSARRTKLLSAAFGLIDPKAQRYVDLGHRAAGFGCRFVGEGSGHARRVDQNPQSVSSTMIATVRMPFVWASEFPSAVSERASLGLRK